MNEFSILITIETETYTKTTSFVGLVIIDIIQDTLKNYFIMMVLMVMMVAGKPITLW